MKPITDPLARVGAAAPARDDFGPLFAGATAGVVGPTRAPFEPPPPGRAMPETSIEAHRRAAPRLAGRRARVLQLVVECDRTCDECCALMGGLGPHQVSGCFTKLARLGLIEDGGDRRATRTGTKAIVWRATDAGRAAAARGGA